ncbi:MAG TPA: tetratricopeptide repeat protein [Candidatus Obscuribacter sp.]|nr:tetratricopeptide repeat protein [Candidatus Obscuribacter sp.]MBK9276975.1 tetratricopeptide repeat protein [Candidatus Obscuribacter sp.]HND67115.1 tetratricopeptide repeat protein [Candidatus Obscuribacter sp.]
MPGSQAKQFSSEPGRQQTSDTGRRAKPLLLWLPLVFSLNLATTADCTAQPPQTEPVKVRCALPAGKNPKVLALFKQAGILLNEKKFQAAIDVYSYAISIEPKNGYAYFHRAACYGSLGKRADSLKDLKVYAHLLATRPGATDNDKLLELYLPQVASTLNRYENSEKGRAALTKDLNNVMGKSNININKPHIGLQAPSPEDLPAYRKCKPLFDKLEHLKVTGDDTGALGVAREIVRLLPNYSYCHQQLGCCYFDLDKLPLAIEEFNKGVALNPKDPYVLMSRAIAYSLDGQYERAEKDYDGALALASYRTIILDDLMAVQSGAFAVPSKDEIWLRKGELAMKQKQNAKALKAFDEAIKFNKRSDGAFLLRARCHESMGNLDAAIADYNAILQFNPKDEAAYKARGDLYFKKKDYPKALSDFSRVIALEPREAWRAYDARAKVFDKLGNAAAARADRQMVSKLGFQPSR